MTFKRGSANCNNPNIYNTPMAFLVRLTDELYVDLNQVKKIEIVQAGIGTMYMAKVFMARDDANHWTQVNFETKEKAQEFIRNIATVSRDHTILDPKRGY